MKQLIKKRGFTLIELLVVIGIIAILAAIVIIAINPARQFAQARNAQRWNDVNAILNAIHQQAVDNKGIIYGDIPDGTYGMIGVGSGCADAACDQSITTPATCINLGGVLEPKYLSKMAFDPSSGYSESKTGYYVTQNTVTRRVTVGACHAELYSDEGVTINVTR